MSFFGFGATPKITINIKQPHNLAMARKAMKQSIKPFTAHSDEKQDKSIDRKKSSKPFATDSDDKIVRTAAGEELVVFNSFDSVSGTVQIELPFGKKFEHTGIKIELVGQVDFVFDTSSTFQFTSVARELEMPGTLFESKEYSFDFANVEKEYDTYNGHNARLRYFIRVKVGRNYAPSLKKIQDFAVETYGEPGHVDKSIKMEVGIEDCLHIEFEYEREKYSLLDCIVGKIHFLLVRIKIKHMEIQMIRRESTGTGSQQFHDNTVVSKYEIMDGAPVRGETVPIRLYLSPLPLTVTLENVHNRFSVKYFLNLVLVDEEDRRYFKQHEIILYRPHPESSSTQTSGTAHVESGEPEDQ